MRVASVILLSVIISFRAIGQQRVGSVVTDSVVAEKVIVLDPGISLVKPTLLFPLSLQSGAELTIPPFWLSAETPGVPPPLLGGVTDLKADLTSPLRLQMEHEAKLKPIRMVLGTIVAGGAVYEAYRYIKKYGLK